MIGGKWEKWFLGEPIYGSSWIPVITWSDLDTGLLPCPLNGSALLTVEDHGSPIMINTLPTIEDQSK